MKNDHGRLIHYSYTKGSNKTEQKKRYQEGFFSVGVE